MSLGLQYNILTEEIDGVSDAEWRGVVETCVEEICQEVSSPGAHDHTVEQTTATGPYSQPIQWTVCREQCGKLFHSEVTKQVLSSYTTAAPIYITLSWILMEKTIKTYIVTSNTSGI